MPSEHGYTTVALLESYAGLDYSAMDAKYTDTIIESNITMAEYIVNAKCDDDFTGAVPDGAKAATLEIAKRLMQNMLVADGYAIEKITVIDPFVEQLIDMIIKNDKNTYDFKLVSGVTDHFFTD